jgi:hypothetical protein
MANNFTALESYKTVQVLSGTTVQDVQYVTCQTNAHGLGFAYPVPYDSWTADQGVALLTEIATALEDLYNEGQVIASDPSQDLDASGLLVDYVDITVGYAQPGLPTLTGVASVPVLMFTSDVGEFKSIIAAEGGSTTTPADLVAAEYARLEAIAGG